MNKNSQPEFRFTSQDGLQIACTGWKSRGPARGVVQFMNDPLCFSTLQPKSTESFLAASARLADTDALSRIRPTLPMYPFSGSEDPVGRQLGGVRTLIRRYRKARVPTISYDFYESGRREMLKELNRGEVRTNIMVWLSSVLHDQSRNREALWTR
jgi:alpha-beta hydrolase superfamily lysophospholipase